MSERRAIQTEHAPAAIGPYAQAVRSGAWIFTSGQIGLDPGSGRMVGGGVVPETRQALDNLTAVLAAAGATLRDVVKATIYLADLEDFEAVNAEYAARFDGPSLPARSTVQVSRLPRDARVEIELVAHCPEGRDGGE